MNDEALDAFIFGLTILVADGVELGLVATAPTRPDGSLETFLCVESVKAGGAVDAWNRQCGSSGAAEKVLHPGDRITRVNDVDCDTAMMLKECASHRLLRMQIVRRFFGGNCLGGPAAAPAQATAASVPARLGALSVPLEVAGDATPPEALSRSGSHSGLLAPQGEGSGRGGSRRRRRGARRGRGGSRIDGGQGAQAQVSS